MRDVVKKNIFTFALLNARSLKNKIDSLEKTMNELGTDICVITETWFKPEDQSIKTLLEDFKHRTGYDFLRRGQKGRRNCSML